MASSTIDMNFGENFNELPTGPLAGQMIKAIHNIKKNNLFPSGSVYANDWSEAISYLGKKRPKNSSLHSGEMESPRVYLPLTHPIEGRNNPQPSKPFIHWRVPSRFSRDFHDQDLIRQILADSNQLKTKRQHDLTQTTHFAPPFGKFQPIKTEQQDHLQEVYKQKEALQKFLEAKQSKFPRLPLSARLPAQVRRNNRHVSRSATNQSWSVRNERKQKENNQLIDRSKTTNTEEFLSKLGDSQAQDAFRSWYESASESDQKAALNFLISLSRKKSPRKFQDSHVDLTAKNERKQMQRVLNTLGKIRPQASPPNPEVLLSLDRNARALDKATEQKHHRLFTPASSFKNSELQTWHRRPVYLHRERMNHVLSMYTLPNEPVRKDFKIHPEWKF